MEYPVKSFGPNNEGRDFVIGDLHGCYDVLLNLIKKLRFDSKKDRMFSVGDIVDRGPKSLKCLTLLDKPWFHSVLANHEQMMWEAFYGGPMGKYWPGAGGMWGVDDLYKWQAATYDAAKLHRSPSFTESQHQLFNLLDKIPELPFIITVEKRNGEKLHIVHAELPSSVAITDDDLADPAKVLELATYHNRDGEFFLWGRAIYQNFYRMDLNDVEKVKRTAAYHLKRMPRFHSKISHVISGHTVLRKPLTIADQTCIDTGAFGLYEDETKKWECLTCVDINEWKFYQATATDFREVEPVVVTREDINSLSG